jgi:hypothetical protein
VLLIDPMCRMPARPQRRDNSGDVYVEHGDQYDDPRRHQVSWDELRDELPHYSELVGFPVDAVKLLLSLSVVVIAFMVGTYSFRT